MSSHEEVFEKEKEKFHSYLDEYGVLDKITDVLIMLFNEPEQPNDPIEYVRRNMCEDNPEVEKIAELKSLIEKNEMKMAELQKTRDKLKAELEQMEENEEYLDEDREEGILQNDVSKEVDAAE